MRVNQIAIVLVGISLALAAFQNCAGDNEISQKDTFPSSGIPTLPGNTMTIPPPLPTPDSTPAPSPSSAPIAYTNCGGTYHGQNVFTGGAQVQGVACYMAQCLNGAMYCSILTADGGSPTAVNNPNPSPPASCGGSYWYATNIFTNGGNAGGVSCYMAQCLNGSILCSIPAGEAGLPSASAPGSSPSPYQGCAGGYLHGQNIFTGGGHSAPGVTTACYMAQCLNGTNVCIIPVQQ